MAKANEKDERFPVEVRTVTYLPAGKAPEVTRDEPSLDPELAKIREREVKALADVKVDTARKEPSIDPELVKARDAEIKRLAKRAEADAPARTVAASEPAKKSAPKKSSK